MAMQEDPSSLGSVNGTSLEPESVDRTARQILALVLRHRRTNEPDSPCATSPCEACLAPHLDLVRAAVRQRRPVPFVLPAFPAKSPNYRKVLGPLPDRAERAALDFLRELMLEIASLHPPGAKLTICSDGRVFSDLVLVDDDNVTAYKSELAGMLDARGGDVIDVLTLDMVFSGHSFEAMRRALAADYATPLVELRRQVIAQPDMRSLFNGIHRFLFEDRVALQPGESRNKLREATKELALGVIQRSQAWTALVAERFPCAIRLSIHPQPCHSPKLGVHLLPTADSWLTPWHGALLEQGTTLSLVRRSDAERLGASLIHQRGVPSHFLLPARAPS